MSHELTSFSLHVGPDLLHLFRAMVQLWQPPNCITEVRTPLWPQVCNLFGDLWYSEFRGYISWHYGQK